jgi:hypothetical protein
LRAIAAVNAKTTLVKRNIARLLLFTKYTKYLIVIYEKLQPG